MYICLLKRYYLCCKKLIHILNIVGLNTKCYYVFAFYYLFTRKVDGKNWLVEKFFSKNVIADGLNNFRGKVNLLNVVDFILFLFTMQRIIPRLISSYD